MGKEFWEGPQTQVTLSDRNHGTGKEEAERRGIGADNRRLPVVRGIGWLCLLFILTNLQTNRGTYKRFQQTQRNSIDKYSAWEYVQIESNNPQQHKRYPTLWVSSA